MCGIVGILSQNCEGISEEILRRMNEEILHRGPDDDGYWLGDHVGLAMRRLSILDPSAGKQPFFSEDGQIVVVYNGEIYNFPELREGLVQRGHTLRTHCDTEILPHLYEEMGDAFVEKLNGMFAIALWDRARQRLVLVRDRLGIKPLFYAQMRGKILFASELKALVVAGISRDVSREAIYHYLTYSYVPAPHTVYENVFKLPPGHLAICDKRGVEVKRYWDVHPSPGPARDEGQWLDELEALLQDAVRRQLISDVPLGALLSGGVDSSLVVAMMSRACAGRVKTFTIGFDEASYDETRHARAVAERFGTDHHELVVRSHVADHFERILLQFDEPFADSSAIPTFFVSQLARQHVTVALSGDGGDELFAGYLRYQAFLRKRPLFNIPRFIRRHTFGQVGDWLPEGVFGRRFLRSLALDPMADYVVGRVSIDNRSLLSPDFLPPARHLDTMDIAGPCLRARYPSELDALCMHDLKFYLPDDILTKVDRMSMAVSLEVRPPILDHRVVEFAFRLPPRLRLRGRQGKYILKRLLERYLPRELVYRPKQGFAVPLEKWFRSDLRELLLDALNPEAIRRAGIFNEKTVKWVIDMHMRDSKNYASKLWQILAVQVWASRSSGASVHADTGGRVFPAARYRT